MRRGSTYPHIHQGGIYTGYTPRTHTQGGIYREDTSVHTPREAYTGGLHPVHTQGGIYREVYTQLYTQGNIYKEVYRLYTQGGIYKEVYPVIHPGRHIGRCTQGGIPRVCNREVYTGWYTQGVYKRGMRRIGVSHLLGE